MLVARRNRHLLFAITFAIAMGVLFSVLALVVDGKNARQDCVDAGGVVISDAGGNFSACIESHAVKVGR